MTFLPKFVLLFHDGTMILKTNLTINISCIERGLSV